MKGSAVRVRSPAFVRSGKCRRAPDEAEPARDYGIEARGAEAAGEGPGADDADQARPAGRVRHDRPAAVAGAGGGVVGQAAVEAPNSLAERADHRPLLEAALLAEDTVADPGPEDALLGRLQAAGDVEAP